MKRGEGLIDLLHEIVDLLHRGLSEPLEEEVVLPNPLSGFADDLVVALDANLGG